MLFKFSQGQFFNILFNAEDGLTDGGCRKVRSLENKRQWSAPKVSQKGPGHILLDVFRYHLVRLICGRNISSKVRNQLKTLLRQFLQNTSFCGSWANVDACLLNQICISRVPPKATTLTGSAEIDLPTASQIFLPITLRQSLLSPGRSPRLAKLYRKSFLEY